MVVSKLDIEQGYVHELTGTYTVEGNGRKE
jgi:hypothetical protein